MEMQLYALHVVPFIIIIYLGFLLFMQPPRTVVGATLLGGLTLGVLSALVDLGAYYASLWHYTVSGLALHLPLPYYTTQIFIYGALAYLLIWRYWNTRSRWFAWLLLIGVPLLGFLYNFLSARESQPVVVWDSILAGPLNFIAWLLMFYAGYLVFRQFAPVRQPNVTIA